MKENYNETTLRMIDHAKHAFETGAYLDALEIIKDVKIRINEAVMNQRNEVLERESACYADYEKGRNNVKKHI